MRYVERKRKRKQGEEMRGGVGRETEMKVSFLPVLRGGEDGEKGERNILRQSTPDERLKERNMKGDSDTRFRYKTQATGKWDRNRMQEKRKKDKETQPHELNHRPQSEREPLVLPGFLCDALSAMPFIFSSSPDNTSSFFSSISTTRTTALPSSTLRTFSVSSVGEDDEEEDLENASQKAEPMRVSRVCEAMVVTRACCIVACCCLVGVGEDTGGCEVDGDGDDRIPFPERRAATAGECFDGVVGGVMGVVLDELVKKAGLRSAAKPCC